MLGEFGAILDEIVRGARELHGALVAARKEIAPLVTRLQQPKAAAQEPPTASAPQVPGARERTSWLPSAAWLVAALRGWLSGPPAAGTSPQGAQGGGLPAAGEAPRAESPPLRPPPLAAGEAPRAESRPLRPPLLESLRSAPWAAAPPPPRAGAVVLDLERLAATNARAISQALRRQQEAARPGTATHTVRRVVSPQARRRAGPRPAASPLQRLLQGRGLRHRIRAMQAAPSPLWRYVGTALRQYSEGGSLRQFFRSLRLAPRAMAQPAALQQAAQAGISAGQLARGAQLVGLAGRAGSAAVAAGSVLAGPLGLAAGAVVGLVAGFLKLNAALQHAVLGLEQFAGGLARVHPGMARIAMEAEIRQLREQQRVAAATYGTTRLARDTTAQFRRETEEFRIYLKNLANLGVVLLVWVVRIVKLLTPLGLIVQFTEKLSGPLNKALAKYLGKEEKEIEVPWLKWLETLGNPKQGLPRRRRPEQPFNRGPEEKRRP